MTRYGPGKCETLKVKNSSPPVSCLSILPCFPGPVPFTLTVVGGEPIALFDQHPKVPQMVRLPAAKPPRLSSERCYIYTYHLHIHLQLPPPHSASCSSTSGVCAPVGGRKRPPVQVATGDTTTGARSVCTSG